MALPSFSYSISRPYPYKWFTWAVIIGGIFATVFFSILNLAANGYNLEVLYSPDYNETVAQDHWTRHFPFSWVDKTVPTCQSQELFVNSRLLTNNSALPYTLTGVSQSRVNGTTTLPSLSYTNNFLENCSIAFIEVDLESTQRTAAQQGWGPWGPKAFAQVSCSINNDNVPTSVDLTVGYEFITPTIETGVAYSFIQQPNNKTEASLWWGQSILSWYWLNLATAMNNHSKDVPNQSINKGSLIFRRSNIDDMTSLDFFTSPNYHFTIHLLDSNGDIKGEPGCCINPAGHNYSNSISNLALHNEVPNIWIEADSFAKSFYASIMADLGQNSSENILLNEAGLQYFTENLTNTVEPGQDSSVQQVWLATNPATASYESVKAITGGLGITPSVLYAQYLCEIPRLKSGGSLFVAVLIADLVFLQALWKIVNWITIFWLERNDRQANFCDGCLKGLNTGIELSSTESTRTTQYLPLPDERPQLRGRNVGHATSDSQEGLIS